MLKLEHDSAARGRTDAGRSAGAAGVGLVHDYLLVLRGAERTFAAIAELWPQAPVYTLAYDDAAMRGRFAGRTVQTSPLQRLGVRQSNFRRFLPVFPYLAERLPVDRHDLIVSSSSAFAHGVRAAPGAVHVCYCHSPFRYAWHERERALAEVRPYLRPVLGRVLTRIQDWDRRAAQRVTHYIANSEITRERLMRFYGREARVVHPPVDVDRFSPAEPEDFLLVVAELVPHKSVDVALEAARRARIPIKIVGTGPDLPRLQALYGSYAEFLGRVPDRDLAALYARALAVVIPNVEEFGIVAVEAQAAGRPVVAADGGGARETVVEGVSGVFVRPGDADELAQAIRSTDFRRFPSDRIAALAARFSAAAFRQRFSAEVTRLVP